MNDKYLALNLIEYFEQYHFTPFFKLGNSRPLFYLFWSFRYNFNTIDK